MEISSNIIPLDTVSYGGFLSGFIEASVEKAANGVNGDCIVHYSGKQSKYEMIVKLENKKRNGIAQILRNGVPHMKVEYKDGVLTGVVERMNSYGIVDLRGQLVNGLESGLFEEFDNNEQVVWQGYYRNGMRYSEVVESERLKGYYDERSVSSGLLLSISQYDDSLHDKNGHCMEYENGNWVGEWVYENGKKRRPIREYRNGKISLYDENGANTFIERLSKDEVKNGFYGHESMEGMEGYCKEVNSNGELVSIAEYDALRMKKNGKCFELENGKVKRVCLYKADRLVRVMIVFNGSTMTEYDSSGREVYEGGFRMSAKYEIVREGNGKEYVLQEVSSKGVAGRNGITSLVGEWRKGKKNGKLYEVGEDDSVIRVCIYENDQMIRVVQEFHDAVMIEYNNNGKRVYEGGFKGDRKNGFTKEGDGIEYDGESRVALYSGQWKNGEREGLGTEYHDGYALYTGEWRHGMRNGRGKEMDEKGKVIYSGLWWNGIRSSVFSAATIIVALSAVVAIISLVAGAILRAYSVTINDCDQMNQYSVHRSNLAKSLSFEQAYKCERIEIGKELFRRVRVFEVYGKNELESIDIGEKSFTFTETTYQTRNRTIMDGDCRIVNCSKLQFIRFGARSFFDYHSLELSSLPSLQSIDMGEGCFYYAPLFSLVGRFEKMTGILDLPQLQSITLGKTSFHLCQSVVFEGILVASLMIQICPNCSPFNWVMMPSMAMKVMIGKRFLRIPTTSIIH